ncbi:hypothetical protein LTS08_004335 [Lithohypha guttulata]|uniref:DUF7908 domain-containing protein n=1 Tax=Lithohypha guttulata TaxID=1690604 RepID=A0AAN7Y705_9EURO|nr:hypothetical protein LTR05_003518 [Lithohypha guttulata]KAK5101876.1 hypothetical protein LTS08_004335 [Lithohypha guttulata]
MPYSTATDPKKTPDPEGFAHKGWGPWQQGNPARPTPGRPNNPWGRPPPTSSQQGNDPSDPPSVTSTPAAQQGNQQGGSGWGPWPRPDAGTTTTLTTSTLTTSTSTTTTTTIIDGPEETSGFYIEVTYSGLKRRYMKRGDTSYVGFLDGSDDASVVTENPYKFFFDRQGYLRTGRQYIAADASSGYFVFEKTSSKPASVPKYKLTADGTFTHESGGFCATTSNFFVTFGSAPGNCRPVTCRSRKDLGPVVTTTTSSITITSTSTSSTSSTTSSTTSPATTTTTTTTTSTDTITTTTTTADPSADLDYPDPTPKPGSGRGFRFERSADCDEDSQCDDN